MITVVGQKYNGVCHVILGKNGIHVLKSTKFKEIFDKDVLQQNEQLNCYHHHSYLSEHLLWTLLLNLNQNVD